MPSFGQIEPLGLHCEHISFSRYMFLSNYVYAEMCQRYQRKDKFYIRYMSQLGNGSFDNALVIMMQQFPNGL
jgi:hypothetical protein